MKSSLSTALQLSARPDTSPLYALRLYPLSLERSALLAQCESEERRGLAIVDVAYEEEKIKIEEEREAGNSRVRERLLEGLEERRKKAREEKEGEGASGGMSQVSPSLFCIDIILHRRRFVRLAIAAPCYSKTA